MRRRKKTHSELILSTCFAIGALARAEVTGDQSIHTVFTTECSTYFNWQALGMFHSHKKSGQEGPVTRLLSCTEEQLKHYKDIEGVPTHIAPSWTIHPKTGDNYSGINKPVAVRDWLEKVKPQEAYILIIDSDTVMREGFGAAEMGLKPGWAVSGFYGYLKGVDNELAMKHIPQIPPRNDTFAGPKGRRSDQVGGFTFMGREDLERMASDWVTITEDVRADPDAWTLSGDVFTKNPGDKPWIAEMYGYSYGAAKANVWHHTDDRVMLYPGYLPLALDQPPKVLHYGIEFKIKEPAFSFDKHWYLAFDPLRCPPWSEVNAAGRPTGGLFPNPPHPSKLTTEGLELLRDLLAIETMATINEALCLRHVKACRPSQELDERCHEVFELAKAVTEAQKALATTAPVEVKCADDDERCGKWASSGECDNNPRYMQAHCKLSCKACQKDAPKKDEAPAVKVLADAGNNIRDKGEGLRKREVGRKSADFARLRQADGAQRLSAACHANTRLSMDQVTECLKLAQMGKAYEAPPAGDATIFRRQARPNLASEELRKSAPGGEKAAEAVPTRRLSEGLRERENEELDGEQHAVVIVGVGVLVVAILVKTVGSAIRKRRPNFGKGVRRD